MKWPQNRKTLAWQYLSIFKIFVNFGNIALFYKTFVYREKAIPSPYVLVNGYVLSFRVMKNPRLSLEFSPAIALDHQHWPPTLMMNLKATTS
jgi:hypothetical protein